MVTTDCHGAAVRGETVKINVTKLKNGYRLKVIGGLKSAANH